MLLSFQAANPSDIPLIYQLAEKIWHAHYPDIITRQQINFMLQSRYSEEAIRQGMESGEKFFLAYQDDIPVGYASIEQKPEYCYLHKFYLDVSKHRTGIGQQFFNYLLQHTDTTKPVKLQVNRQNIKAVNFYFKAGFTIQKAEDFDIGGGYFMNDFVMIRKPDAL